MPRNIRCHFVGRDDPGAPFKGRPFPAKRRAEVVPPYRKHMEVISMSEENLYTFENETYRKTYWHTCSHILA